jgi:serine/threonine protein kinase
LGLKKDSNRLGEGSFKAVYRATWQKQDVAVSLLKVNLSVSSNLTEEFKSEAKRMRGLTHPNLLKVHGVVLDPTRAALVTEYMPGTLFVALHGPPRTSKKHAPPAAVASPPPVPIATTWTLADRLPILLAMSSAVNYLHGQGVAHHDINSHNFLVSPTPRSPHTSGSNHLFSSIAHLRVTSSSSFVTLGPQSCAVASVRP